MLIITSSLLFLAFVTLLHLFLRKSKVDAFMDNFAGPTTLPIIGNFWYFLKPEDRFKKFMRLQSMYGDRIGFSGGGLKVLLLCHPNDVGKILGSKDLNKSRLYEMGFSDWLGGSLFFTRGMKEYLRKRKRVTPAFDFKRVGNFVTSVNELSRSLIHFLKRNEADRKPADICLLFTLCSLDIALCKLLPVLENEYFTGKMTRCLEMSDQEYATACHNELRCINERIFSPWLWPRFLWKLSPTGRQEKNSRKVLQDFVDKIVMERKAEILTPGINASSPQLRSDIAEKDKLRLLDLLIREQHLGDSDVTDNYIRDDTNAAIFAAHDTVASSLTFTLFLLASNPEEQEKVHLELDDVFGEDRERNVEDSDLPKLNYLECCIKEALRLYPPASVMLRMTEADFQLDEKTTIPGGVEIVISPLVTHRHPEFFPEPEEFRPSRFFHENSIGRHPYAFIPFSAGPRGCMGQKIAFTMEKTILAHIFRNFTMALESPPETMKPLFGTVVFPKNGLKIKLKLR